MTLALCIWSLLTLFVYIHVRCYRSGPAAAAGQRTALATTFTSSVWGQKNSQNVELRLYVLVVKSSYILALQYKAVVFDDWQDLARQDGSFVATNPLLHTTTYSMAKGRTAGGWASVPSWRWRGVRQRQLERQTIGGEQWRLFARCIRESHRVVVVPSYTTGGTRQAMLHPLPALVSSARHSKEGLSRRRG